MTNQEINRLIAEACPTVAGVWSDGELRWDSKLRPVPTCFDPVNDLNAMHEAEKVIAAQSKEHDYWFFVRQIIGFSDAQGDWDEVDHFKAIHATARQRAEAFVRTLGKWRE